ncbi:MAG: PAS domain S-box protein [Methanobacteriaceae archaeon]|nr:PAS domain S-box protein [Methanobacteriaceae archaeon]MDP2836894.1 PAS domain S-box protein [Methanobacteriaceae archaeon]
MHKISLDIVIVEDEAITALDIKRKLEHWGHSAPKVAHSGADAIQLVNETNPDLILMDIVLKGEIDGIETVNEIKKSHDIPIIYLTAHSEEKIMARAKYTEPYGYLIKPIDDKELFFAVESAFYKHSVDKKLKKVNRALRMISDCNQSIVRIKDKDELLNNVCRLIVEEGGYILAWVGMAENDEFKSVRPVAQYGFDNGYLESIQISWGDNKYSTGPTGRAIKNSEVSISRDILKDTSFKLWQAKAIARNYNSSIALPLFIGKETVGSLNIYSSEIEAYDEKEVELLQELAGDISYYLESFNILKEKDLALKKLKESEIRYRNLFENSEEGIYQSTARGKYIHVNPALARMAGFESPEAMISEVKDISKFYVNPDDRKNLKKRLEKEDVVKDYHVEVFLKNGKNAWISITEKAIRNDKNEILYYEGLARDVTREKKISEQLKLSEEKYRNIIETSNEGIWSLDENFNTIFVNKKMGKMLGYKISEMLNKDFLDFIPPEYLDEQKKRIELRKNGISQKYHCQLICNDGNKIGVLVSATPQINENGEFTGSYAMCTDLNEIKDILFESDVLNF